MPKSNPTSSTAQRTAAPRAPKANTTLSKVATLWGHKKPITALAFSPDAKLLVSGSKDTTVRLWNVEGGARSRTMSDPHTWCLVAACFSPDAHTVVSVSRGVNGRSRAKARSL